MTRKHPASAALGNGLLLLAIGFAASPSGRADAAGDPPEQIIYREVGPHGVGTIQWSLWSGGAGTYYSDADGDVPVKTALKLGPEGFRKIRAVLRPLEARRDIQCSLAATDQRMGALTWVRGYQHVVFHVDFGCSPATDEDADLIRCVEDALDMVRGSAGVSRSNDGGTDLLPGPACMPEGGELSGNSCERGR